MKTVNEKEAAARSLAPRATASEEGRPERVPAAGNGNGTSLDNAGSNGNYWSSVPNSDSENARNLNFNSDNRNVGNNNRNNGQSVRPVQVFAATPQGGGSHRSSPETANHVGFPPAQGEEAGRATLLADLIVAYRDARRHKRNRDYQTRFEMEQERLLVDLRDELWERRYEARPSSCFVVHDPKMREVFAAEFRDRVVHHLFYNYTHELFERTFIADSYSCIEGRGTHFGVARLKHHLLSCSRNWTAPCFVLKLDIKGYFMSINRQRLLARCRELLRKQRRIAESRGCGVLPDWDLVDYLLESICMLDPLKDCRMVGDGTDWDKLPPEKSLFHSRPGCGLPIGNLSSQLFSNVYLGMFDDFMKRELGCRHYGRYVDDAFVAGASKTGLLALVPKARRFLRDELGLELNEKKVRVVDAFRGVEFLGAFVKPFRTYPATRSLKRIKRRLKAIDMSDGPLRVQARTNSLLGVLSHFDSWNIRKVAVWESGLRRFGRFSRDCLRFYPDVSFSAT